MYYSFPSRHNMGYKFELDHFIDVVQSGSTESSVCDRMVKAITKIATACEDSANSGLPVKLNWSKDEVPKGYVM